MSITLALCLRGNVRVIQLNAVATPLINKFYQQHRGRGRATKQDQNWVAKDLYIIAACRVQNKEGLLLLSSVLVAPEFRNKGVARALLTQALCHQTGDVYTFAYRHLYSFYQRLNFVECLLPPALQPYFNSYIAQKRDIVAMCLSK